VKFDKPVEDTTDKKRKFVREAGGEVWQDETLSDWPENDFRIFVGDLGPETNDQKLAEAFSQFKSLARAKVVLDKRLGKSKGFGFVSFLNPEDGVNALIQMDGKYIGSRPCSLKKSTWEDRDRDSKKKKKNHKFQK
jgi:RNA recognition motif-containing protein